MRISKGFYILLLIGCLGVKSLLPAQVQQQDTRAFITAVKMGLSGYVTEFLSDPHIDVNVKNSDGIPVLLLAIANKKKNIFDLLLADPRIDVNARDRHGNTALVLAAQEGYTDAVRELLKYPHINVDIKGARNKTALEEAREAGYHDIVKLITAHIQQRPVSAPAAVHSAAASAPAAKEKVAVPSTIEQQYAAVRAELLKVQEELQRTSSMLEEEKSKKLCKVCQERKKSTVFLPCGHYACCPTCAGQIIVRHQSCPICRRAITRIQAVYES